MLHGYQRQATLEPTHLNDSHGLGRILELPLLSCDQREASEGSQRPRERV